MGTRDSGVIDLFAIHKEEEARKSATASAPPPGVVLDVGGGSADADGDIEGFAAAHQKARRRAKWVGGAVGGLALIGTLIAVVSASAGREPAKAVAADAPLPPAVTAPQPVIEPPPAMPVPAPPATSTTEKPDYTPATAAAAYAASQGKKRAPAPKKPSNKPVKLQKVQSSGVSN